MYILSLLKDDSDESNDMGLEVGLDNDCMSVYNIFKATESILLSAGYTEYDLREYYAGEQNQGMMN